MKIELTKEEALMIAGALRTFSYKDDVIRKLADKITNFHIEELKKEFGKDRELSK